MTETVGGVGRKKDVVPNTAGAVSAIIDSLWPFRKLRSTTADPSIRKLKWSLGCPCASKGVPAEARVSTRTRQIAFLISGSISASHGAIMNLSVALGSIVGQPLIKLGSRRPG